MLLINTCASPGMLCHLMVILLKIWFTAWQQPKTAEIFQTPRKQELGCFSRYQFLCKTVQANITQRHQYPKLMYRIRNNVFRIPNYIGFEATDINIIKYYLIYVHSFIKVIMLPHSCIFTCIGVKKKGCQDSFYFFKRLFKIIRR